MSKGRVDFLNLRMFQIGALLVGSFLISCGGGEEPSSTPETPDATQTPFYVVGGVASCLPLSP